MLYPIKINHLNHLLAAILLFLVYKTGFSQCFTTNFAFSEGETVTYEVSYNWGFIWLNAGYVEFNVKPGEYHDRYIYFLDAYGSTYKSYDWFFKVRDHYQCYLDKEKLHPLWFHRENYEGGYEVDNRYIFNPDKNIVYAYTQNSKQTFRKDTVNIPPCTFDLLSIIYYARNIDFSGLSIGDSIPIITIIDGEIYDLYIRYLGKETIQSRSGEEYRCIKFSILLVEGTIFKGGENMFVWVSDDRNRIPILVDAKILIGSVKAYVIGIHGIRNPVMSLVE
jgi:hypothetical protein